MLSNVAVAPDAERNAVVTWLQESLQRKLLAPRANTLAQPDDLRRVRATVGFVARDRRVTATMRIDRGSVVLHDGALGTPDVTLCADFDELVALSRHPMSAVANLPLGAHWRALAKEVVSARFRIYGLWSHPRLVLRVLRLLAPEP